MKWGLTITAGGEQIAEHEGVTFASKHFFMMNEDPEQQTVAGLTAYDSEEEAIAVIGGHEFSVTGTQEGLVCVRGLQVHFVEEGQHGKGLYYGVLDGQGGFEEVGDMNDPRLHAEWNLSPLLEGAGYGGTD